MERKNGAAVLQSGGQEEEAGSVTESEQRGAARLKARPGRLLVHSPLDMGLILAAMVLAALFFLESDDCYFVYWQYDSWKDFLLTRPDTTEAQIVGVPQNGRYLGNLIGVLLAKSYETPLFFLRVVYFAGGLLLLAYGGACSVWSAGGRGPSCCSLCRSSPSEEYGRRYTAGERPMSTT